MNRKNHIENLIHKIDRIVKEPLKSWIGKISKSKKIKKLKMKINSLNKRK